jgi:hypothetical protein
MPCGSNFPLEVAISARLMRESSFPRANCSSRKQ